MHNINPNHDITHVNEGGTQEAPFRALSARLEAIGTESSNRDKVVQKPLPSFIGLWSKSKNRRFGTLFARKDKIICVARLDKPNTLTLQKKYADIKYYSQSDSSAVCWVCGQAEIEVSAGQDNLETAIKAAADMYRAAYNRL